MNLVEPAGRIALKGNAAQVKWGRQIRGKKAAELEKGGVRMVALSLKPHMTEEMLTKLGKMDMNKIASFLKCVCLYLVTIPSGKWWVAHRDDNVYDLLVPAMKTCANYHTKKKTFR